MKTLLLIMTSFLIVAFTPNPDCGDGNIYANKKQTEFDNSSRATVKKYVTPSTSNIEELYMDNNLIGVYPNPTSHLINFSVQTNVQLTTITGQIVANVSNVSTLDISNQPTGIYLITLTNDKGQVLQRTKIVKE
jgi:hypothetical protein